MRAISRFLACLLAAVLLTGVFAAPGLAAVTLVRSTGDGALEVRWDDADALKLVMVPKMSEDFNADLNYYGVLTGDLSGQTRAVLYFIAPGQSYWVFTLGADRQFTAPYAYDAAKAPDFTDFKNPVHFSTWQLRVKNMKGVYSDVDFFSSYDLENTLDDNSFGVRFQYEWPQLKNARSYLAQVVIMSPDGDKYGFDAFQQELPVGISYAYNNYLPLDSYFEYLLDQRGFVPVGTYRFTLYWDGYNVCSETFKVR